MNLRPHVGPVEAMAGANYSDLEGEFESDPKAVYMLAGLLALNCFLSVFGNALILYTFIREKPLGPPLRTILCHLAVTNLVIAGIGEPMVVISGFNLKWVFGEMGRKIEAYTVTASGLMAMSLLAFVSIERYLRVTPGQRFRITEATSVRFCTIMWTYNIVYASLPFYGIAAWRGEGIGISNSLSWNTDNTSDVVYVMIMMATGYFIPLLIITFCYNRILHFVKQAVDVYEEHDKVGINIPPEGMTMETQMSKTNASQTGIGTASGNESSLINANEEASRGRDNSKAPQTSNVESTEGGGGTSAVGGGGGISKTSNSADPNDEPRSRIKAAEKKISNVVAIIIVSFFVSWTPYTIVNLLVTFDRADFFAKGITATIPAMLAKTSTVWSPIIYCFMNGEVRTANLRTIAHLKRRIRILYFGGRI
ncbi:rhodopsin-like isoform X2 [Bolinopsis microptera]|uniref:rhodopsin-like isoform X2 n=1 Tax=Bolinopsis microptera TaxID=2820187 RepID=UPI00307A5D07